LRKRLFFLRKLAKNAENSQKSPKLFKDRENSSGIAEHCQKLPKIFKKSPKIGIITSIPGVSQIRVNGSTRVENDVTDRLPDSGLNFDETRGQHGSLKFKIVKNVSSDAATPPRHIYKFKFFYVPNIPLCISITLGAATSWTFSIRSLLLSDVYVYFI
jgi:hypothetical protein